MKNWLMVLILFPILMLSSCDKESKVVTAGRKINVQLKISAVPEKNLKLYVAEGIAGSYQKISPTLYKPENIKYSARKRIGKTPMEETFTFNWDSSENCWKPTEYALYFIQKDSSENRVSILPWSYHYKDPNSGAEKAVFYDSKQFPLDYFQTHPNVRNLSIQKDLNLAATE
jgi:hypothetical protein